MVVHQDEFFACCATCGVRQQRHGACQCHLLHRLGNNSTAPVHQICLNWGSVEMTNRSKKQPDRDCFLALSPVKFQSLVGFPRGGTFFGDSDSFLKESVKERNS